MRIEEESLEDAIRRASITKYDIVVELKAMALGNIADFYQRDSKGEIVYRDGWPVLDLSGCDESKLRAIKEIVVDEYTDGFGEDAREVKRTRVVLHEKRGPLLDLARMMGMVKPASVTLNQNTQNNVMIVMSEEELLASR
jgi:phage terminase small subunit